MDQGFARSAYQYFAQHRQHNSKKPTTPPPAYTLPPTTTLTSLRDYPERIPVVLLPADQFSPVTSHDIADASASSPSLDESVQSVLRGIRRRHEWYVRFQALQGAINFGDQNGGSLIALVLGYADGSAGEAGAAVAVEHRLLWSGCTAYEDLRLVECRPVSWQASLEGALRDWEKTASGSHAAGGGCGCGDSSCAVNKCAKPCACPSGDDCQCGWTEKNSSNQERERRREILAFRNMNVRANTLLIWNNDRVAPHISGPCVLYRLSKDGRFRPLDATDARIVFEMLSTVQISKGDLASGKLPRPVREISKPDSDDAVQSVHAMIRSAAASRPYLSEGGILLKREMLLPRSASPWSAVLIRCTDTLDEWSGFAIVSYSEAYELACYASQLRCGSCPAQSVVCRSQTHSFTVKYSLPTELYVSRRPNPVASLLLRRPITGNVIVYGQDIVSHYSLSPQSVALFCLDPNRQT